MTSAFNILRLILGVIVLLLIIGGILLDITYISPLVNDYMMFD